MGRDRDEQKAPPTIKWDDLRHKIAAAESDFTIMVSATDEIGTTRDYAISFGLDGRVHGFQTIQDDDTVLLRPRPTFVIDDTDSADDLRIIKPGYYGRDGACATLKDKAGDEPEYDLYNTSLRKAFGLQENIAEVDMTAHEYRAVFSDALSRLDDLLPGMTDYNLMNNRMRKTYEDDICDYLTAAANAYKAALTEEANINNPDASNRFTDEEMTTYSGRRKAISEDILKDYDPASRHHEQNYSYTVAESSRHVFSEYAGLLTEQAERVINNPTSPLASVKAAEEIQLVADFRQRFYEKYYDTDRFLDKGNKQAIVDRLGELGLNGIALSDSITSYDTIRNVLEDKQEHLRELISQLPEQQMEQAVSRFENALTAKHEADDAIAETYPTIANWDTKTIDEARREVVAVMTNGDLTAAEKYEQLSQTQLFADGGLPLDATGSGMFDIKYRLTDETTEWLSKIVNEQVLTNPTFLPEAIISDDDKTRLKAANDIAIELASQLTEQQVNRGDTLPVYSREDLANKLQQVQEALPIVQLPDSIHPTVPEQSMNISTLTQNQRFVDFENCVNRCVDTKKELDEAETSKTQIAKSSETLMQEIAREKTDIALLSDLSASHAAIMDRDSIRSIRHDIKQQLDEIQVPVGGGMTATEWLQTVMPENSGVLNDGVRFARDSDILKFMDASYPGRASPELDSAMKQINDLMTKEYESHCIVHLPSPEADSFDGLSARDYVDKLRAQSVFINALQEGGNGTQFAASIQDALSSPENIAKPNNNETRVSIAADLAMNIFNENRLSPPVEQTGIDAFLHSEEFRNLAMNPESAFAATAQGTNPRPQYAMDWARNIEFESMGNDLHMTESRLRALRTELKTEQEAYIAQHGFPSDAIRQEDRFLAVTLSVNAVDRRIDYERIMSSGLDTPPASDTISIANAITKQSNFVEMHPEAIAGNLNSDGVPRESAAGMNAMLEQIKSDLLTSEEVDRLRNIGLVISADVGKDGEQTAIRDIFTSAALDNYETLYNVRIALDGFAENRPAVCSHIDELTQNCWMLKLDCMAANMETLLSSPQLTEAQFSFANNQVKDVCYEIAMNHDMKIDDAVLQRLMPERTFAVDPVEKSSEQGSVFGLE